MKNWFLYFIGLILILMVGCSTESGEPNHDSNLINISNVSSKNMYDQGYSNRAKQLLMKKDNITKAVAINTDKLLIIGIEVPHHERFQLKGFEKDLTKEMKKEFKKTKLTVELSSDKKIIWELENLEEKIRESSISKKELKKQLQHINKLMKEKT